MDTYERTYSSFLLQGQPSTTNDYAIACALADNEKQQAPPPRPDTSLDSQLALQLHEKEVERLVHSPGGKRKVHRRDRALRALLKTLNITKVIPRLNPCFHPDDSYISQDRQRLLLRLDMYALQERPVIGDGNCQFRAIADQLYSRQDMHLQVRQRVVEQLCGCPERYKDYVTTDYQQYVSSMSSAGTWGDHVTLKAAADAFNVRICIISSFLDNCVISIHPTDEAQQQGQQPGQQEQQGQQAPDLGATTGQTLWLAFWAEVHYNSLAAKAPASPSESSDDDSSSSSASSEGKRRKSKLLGSKKLRQAADAVMGGA